MLHIINQKNTESIMGACGLCGFKGMMTLIIDRVLCSCGNIQRKEEMPDPDYVQRRAGSFQLKSDEYQT